jgi:hypothetical protein
VLNSLVVNVLIWILFNEDYVVYKLLFEMYIKVTPSVLSRVVHQYQFPDVGPRTENVGY